MSGGSVRSTGGILSKTPSAVNITSAAFSCGGALKCVADTANGQYDVPFQLFRNTGGFRTTFEFYRNPPDDGTPNTLQLYYRDQFGGTGSASGTITTKAAFYGKWIHWCLTVDASGNAHLYMLFEGFNSSSPSFLIATNIGTIERVSNEIVLWVEKSASTGNPDPGTLATTVRQARFFICQKELSQAEVLAQFAQRALTAAVAAATPNQILDLSDASGTNPQDDTGSANSDWTNSGGGFADETDEPSEWGGAPKSIAIAQGSYSHTGQAVGLRKQWRLVCGQGTYSHTGQSVGLAKSAPKTIVCASGTYAHTGQAVTLRRAITLVCETAVSEYQSDSVGINLLWNRRLVAAQGSYSHTGQTTAFRRALREILSQGSYSHTGQTVGLAKASAKSIACAQGTYAHTGQLVGLLRGRRLVAVAGSYLHTGQTVILARGLRLALTAGSYAHFGQSTVFRWTRRLVVSQGSYAQSGQAVTLSKTSARTLLLAAGSYSHTGQLVGLLWSRRIVAQQGSYSYSGQAVALRRGRFMALALGSYVHTGQAVSFARTRRLLLDFGVYAHSGQPAALRRGLRLAAVPGSYTLTGQPILGLRGKGLAVESGAYVHTGGVVGLDHHVLKRLLLQTGVYVLTGRAVALLYSTGFVEPPAIHNPGAVARVPSRYLRAYAKVPR